MAGWSVLELGLQGLADAGGGAAGAGRLVPRRAVTSVMRRQRPGVSWRSRRRAVAGRRLTEAAAGALGLPELRGERPPLRAAQSAPGRPPSSPRDPRHDRRVLKGECSQRVDVPAPAAGAGRSVPVRRLTARNRFLRGRSSRAFSATRHRGRSLLVSSWRSCSAAFGPVPVSTRPRSMPQVHQRSCMPMLLANSVARPNSVRVRSSIGDGAVRTYAARIIRRPTISAASTSRADASVTAVARLRWP